MKKVSYVCKKIETDLTIDGDLTKAEWQDAEKTRRFIDIIGENPSLYDTRAAMLYNDKYLYIGFWAEDPFPEAHLTQRDDLIWFENDIEVFIDGGDTYYEFQINALNTIYEVLYIWQDAYKKNYELYKDEFDLLKRNALSFGGNHDRQGKYFWKGSHPRRNRWAFRDWDFPGLKTAVKVHGELNCPERASKGITVELAFPWEGMKWLADGRALPPKDGDCWNIFLGRYQQLKVNGEKVSVGWALDPIGTDDNHYPEKFSPILFSE